MANEALSRLYNDFEIRPAGSSPIRLFHSGKTTYAKIYPYGDKICAADDADDLDEFTVVNLKQIPDRELTEKDFIKITKVNTNNAEGIIEG